MFINFWYPVCCSDELKEQPLSVTMLTLPFAVFRDSAGVAQVISDTCVHRGGSLSHGTVKGDTIVCPYHGWRFGRDGHCRLIPSQKSGKPPARATVDAYPTVERYGMVFAFLGDLPEAERPPLVAVPEWDQVGWRASRPDVRVINCNYERSVENGLDPVHNEFVHPSQGLPKMREETLMYTIMPWGTHFIAAFGELQGKQSDEQELASNPDQLRAGSLYHGPNTLVTDIHFNADSAFIQYAFETPIDYLSTRLFLVNLRNCMLDPKLDERVVEINRRVADEDVAILEQLRPVRTPRTNIRELLTESDEMVLRYRAHLREWEQRGWRLDRQKLLSTDLDTAYAIPSPGRRETGNRVLEAAPCVNPRP